MKHAALKRATPLAAAAVALVATASLRAETVDFWKTTPPYPDVVSTSHATPEVALFFKSYFTAKSEHKPAQTTDHFSEAHLTYIDAALGCDHLPPVPASRPPSHDTTFNLGVAFGPRTTA